MDGGGMVEGWMDSGGMDGVDGWWKDGGGVVEGMDGGWWRDGGWIVGYLNLTLILLIFRAQLAMIRITVKTATTCAQVRLVMTAVARAPIPLKTTKLAETRHLLTATVFALEQRRLTRVVSAPEGRLGSR